MKRNFKLNSIFKDKQISTKILFLMIIISNILWISLFYISFNKLNSSNNSDMQTENISKHNYVDTSDNLIVNKEPDKTVADNEIDNPIVDNKNPNVLSFDELSHNGGVDNMSANLIQLYSDDAKTQKAYPIVNASGVFNENGENPIDNKISKTINTNKNLLFDAVFKDNYYYTNKGTANDYYCYFTIPVTDGTTYYIYPTARYVSTPGTKLADNVNGEFTPDFTGDLIVTFAKTTDLDWIITTDSDFSNVPGYNTHSFTKLTLEQRPGFSERRTMSQKAVTDALSLDQGNMLFGSKLHRNKYYGSNETSNDAYSYFEIPVVSGTTYYIYPSYRYISKYKATLVNNADGSADLTYTPDFTGTLYVTFCNNEPDWIFTENPDYSKIGGFNSQAFSEITLAQTTGQSARKTMSQKAITDALLSIDKASISSKNIISFGDSIMHGAGNGDIGIVDILISDYGATGKDYSVSGASMAYHSDRSHIINQIQTAISTETLNPDVILLNGLTNDLGLTIAEQETIGELGTDFDYVSGGYADYTKGMEYAIGLLRDNFPSVPIIFIIPHNTTRDYETELQFVERARAICQKWSVPVVDVYKEGGYNGYISAQVAVYGNNGTDATHPNEKCYKERYIPLLISTLRKVIN